jgi:hypothetical protein
MFISDKHIVMTLKEWDECAILGLWKFSRNKNLSHIPVIQMPFDVAEFNGEFNTSMLYMPANALCELIFKNVVEETWHPTLRERQILYMLAGCYTKTTSFAPVTKRLPVLAFIALLRACIEKDELWEPWKKELTKPEVKKYKYVYYRLNDKDEITEFKYGEK